MGSTWLALDCLGELARKAKESARRNRPARTRRRMECPFRITPVDGFAGPYIGRWPGVVKWLVGCGFSVGGPSVRCDSARLLDRLNSFGKIACFFIHTACIFMALA